MYVYDKRPSQGFDYANCVLGPQRYSHAGTNGRRGLGGVPGVRFGNVERQGAVLHKGTWDPARFKCVAMKSLLLEETKNGTADREKPKSPRVFGARLPGHPSRSDQMAPVRLVSDDSQGTQGCGSGAPFPEAFLQLAADARPLTTDTANPQWVSTPRVPLILFTSRQGDWRIGHRRVITVFDRPGMLIEKTVPTVFRQAKTKFKVEAQSVTFASHFDTYLFKITFLSITCLSCHDHV